MTAMEERECCMHTYCMSTLDAPMERLVLCPPQTIGTYPSLLERKEGLGPLPCPPHRQREEESGHSNNNTLHECIIISIVL